MRIRRFLTITPILLAVLFSMSGCDAIKGLFNPFAGKWKSGLLELDFSSGRSFELVIGSTVSINLNGEYGYDDDTLVLKFDNGSDVNFSYEFSADRKTLTLVPESDFDYIKTKIDFRKE